MKKTRGASHSEKFEARAPDGHHKYISSLAHKSNLFVWLMVAAVGLVCFSFLSDSRIASHLPFACNWQNRFWDSELIVAHFLNNNGGTSDIQIPCNSSELNPAPCMCDVCHVCGLGSN